MAEIKTKATDADPMAFLDAVEHPTRRADGLALLEIYERVTGEPPRMWGTSMVGFGQYHYKSERSRQEGDWPLAAFSPRKAALTLYLMDGFAGGEDGRYAELLAALGKHKTSRGCLYVTKLTDVDVSVLEAIIKHSWTTAQATLL
jgi:hypothetical protein